MRSKKQGPGGEELQQQQVEEVLHVWSLRRVLCTRRPEGVDETHLPQEVCRQRVSDTVAILRLLAIGFVLLVAVVFVIADSPDLAGQVLRYLPGL